VKSLIGRHHAILLTIATGVAIALVVGAGIIDLDPSWTMSAGAPGARDFLRQNGPLAAVGLLYLEESGVPMPVPGDFFVMYLGSRVAGDWMSGLLAWLALTMAVVLGSTNLYWISRRWGRRLVAGRAGAMLHLTPGRIERSERWFGRWGPWALIIGRHIPGFRVPITIAAGSFNVRFRTFALCVGISTATWSAFFLLMGHLLGERAQAFMDVHRTATPMICAAILAVGLVYILGRWVVTGRDDDVTQRREA
jgi:membrane protein DedA with SNARE-associated domain